jgi:hypothetical protein
MTWLALLLIGLGLADLAPASRALARGSRADGCSGRWNG